MRVPVVDLHVCPMHTPSDVSAVRELFDAGNVDPRDVIALVGKTEGSGLGKDTGREMADQALRALLAERLRISTSKVGDRICVILSGGTPGVIAPHVAVVTRRTLRIGHRSMTDILDADAVTGALTSAGMTVEGRPTSEQTARIVYLLAKMIIPGGDGLRGLRITLQDDPMGYHVAKAMGGYLIASGTGKTMCFVSGGERNSHQGPPEGNPLAAIVRMS
jgi:hypothetical protein